MERKYKLQINKPIDKYFNVENIFQTPRTKESDSSSIKNSSLTEIQTVTLSNINECEEEKESYQFTSFFYKFVIFSLVLALIFTNFFKKVPVKINEVVREVNHVPDDYEKIKEELVCLKNKSENMCLLEKQCKVLYENTSLSYKYGFFSVRSTDPHSVLLDNSKCFAFDGTNGKITLSFPKKIKVNKIGIFHPKTKNNSSAIKDFTVNEIPFTFSNDTLSFFDCDLVSDKFIFNICNNHGKKEYTVIYRIFLIGYEM